MPDTIRSFIAIEIPGEIKSQIQKYVDQLKIRLPKLKWVKSESLHITLKFIGEQSAERTEQILTELISCSSGLDPFKVSIKNFGAFPNENRPKVIWMGIEALPRESFFRLYNQVEDGMVKIGFEPEQRRFSPHLTLARIKYPDDFSQLFNYIRMHPFREMSYEVREFVLMRSMLNPSGAEYRILQKYPLRS